MKKQARGMRLHRLPKPKWRWAIELESSEDGEMLEDIDDALIMQGANLFRAGCFAVMFLARLVQVSPESAALVFFCDPPPHRSGGAHVADHVKGLMGRLGATFPLCLHGH